MRKATRLFELLTLLRGRRTAITAEALAEALEVSVRTVYRDVAALQLSGVPVDGEAGVGYWLRPGFHLPPLMFDADELQALLVGGQMVRAFTDPELGDAAARARAKIMAILTDDLKAKAASQPYVVPVRARDNELRATHGQLRKACEEKRKLQIGYTDEKSQHTERIIWPLGLVGWGEVWTLLAWCELRGAYRNFRFDRIASLRNTGETYPEHPSRNLNHYLEGLSE